MRKFIGEFINLLIVMFLMYPLMLLAQTVTNPPTTDAVEYDTVIKAFIELIKNWATTPWYISASGIVVLIVMILKTQLVGGWFGKLGPVLKRCILGLLGIVAGLFISFGQGEVVWYKVLYQSFIVSGGAIMIFEIIISVLPDAWAKAKSVLSYIIELLKKLVPSGK